MGNFYRDGGSRGGYRGGFDRGRRSFGGSRGNRQMFKSVCSNCGKDCEVPFRPTGDKPVYCSDCFEKMGRQDDRRPFDRPRRDDTQLESINAKLDKILNLLQPKEAKPTKSKKASKEKVITSEV